MATSTELKDNLQKISALMGLLRSDMLELAEAPGKLQRAPVFEHIQWIASQLDELGKELSTGIDSALDAPHLATTGDPKHAESSTHTSSSHGAPTGSSNPTSGQTAHRDAAHHAGASLGGMTDKPPIPDDPKQPNDGSDDAAPRRDPAAASRATVPPDEKATTPPLPDVPKMPRDDKPH